MSRPSLPDPPRALHRVRREATHATRRVRNGVRVAVGAGRPPVGQTAKDVVWRHGRTELWLKVAVPVTSLCPCSKRIADYGAHNQRSQITIAARLRNHMWIEELIEIAESEASCELYGILKRTDEKYVTERAYDNPKFVEDMVRDVATRLNGDQRIAAYVVEAENFESIHNHSAYALIEHDKDA